MKYTSKMFRALFSAGGIQFILGFAVVFFTSQALAQVTLNPGDIIVGVPGGAKIIKVDPLTGLQTTIASGAPLVHPEGVAIDAAGNIIVGDVGAFGAGAPNGAIIRVDPATGAKFVISSGGLLVDPIGLAIDAFGDIIVPDPSADGGSGLIIRIKVDPITGLGTQEIITSGIKAVFVAIDASGDIIAPNDTEIIRVDPDGDSACGAPGCAQTPIPTDPASTFVNLEGVAIDAAGNLIVADGSVAPGTDPRIISVHPVTGVQTAVSRNPSGQGNLFWNPGGVAIEADGKIIVADSQVLGGGGKIIRVDPDGDPLSNQTLIASGGDPIGVVIVPPQSVAANTICTQLPFENCPTAVDIQIDMTSTFELLGSFTATLNWDPAIVDYTGNSGLPAGFTEVINEDDIATGLLTFSGVNASGVSGIIDMFTVNFDVIGNEDDVNTFDLEISAMAAANTFNDLLPILTTNDCSSTIDDGGVLGDVNNDGLVNSTDALIVLSHDISLQIPAAFEDRIDRGFGDIDEDVLTNSTDALIILSYDVGLDVSAFPIDQLFCGQIGL